MMTPVARLVLVRATPKRELVSAMAWLTVPALVGPLVGPPVGGFITTFFTWHWIFLINVPIGILGIVLATKVLPDIEPVGAKPIDMAGFLLSAIAASGVVFGLSVVSLPALPPIVGITTLIIGLVCGVIYVRHARRAANPILDLRVFSNATFRAAITGGTIFRIGNGAVPFLLPLMFQLGFGMTPFQSGMLTFASALGAIMMKFLAPVTLRLGGFRNVMICAAIAASFFIAINGWFTPSTPSAVIILVLIGSGLLRSLFFTSTNALVFADIEDKDASQATSISAVSQQISVALGVAVAGIILEAFIYITGAAARSTGVLDGLHDRGGDHGAGGDPVHRAGARCRQLGVGPGHPPACEDTRAARDGTLVGEDGRCLFSPLEGEWRAAPEGVSAAVRGAKTASRSAAWTPPDRFAATLPSRREGDRPCP